MNKSNIPTVLLQQCKYSFLHLYNFITAMECKPFTRFAFIRTIKLSTYCYHYDQIEASCQGTYIYIYIFCRTHNGAITILKISVEKLCNDKVIRHAYKTLIFYRVLCSFILLLIILGTFADVMDVRIAPRQRKLSSSNHTNGSIVTRKASQISRNGVPTVKCLISCYFLSGRKKYTF